MKVIAYDQDDTPEQVVYLRLKQEGSGVSVRAVNEDGSGVAGGNLLRIDPTGIYRFPGVNPKLGFPLDASGRLKVPH